MMLRLNRPFPRFVALGALIFAVNALVAPHEVAAGRRIELNAGDIARLGEMAERQWGHAPNAQQLQEIVRDQVREEILVREARQAGLDQDDEIVRRRLAQKMEFLAQAGVQSPSEAEIAAWFDAHRDAYTMPPAVRLDQRFFSTRLHGAHAMADAEHARAELSAGREARGDDPGFAATQPVQTGLTLAREFGQPFADAVMALPVGGWLGPIASPLGVHLVRMRERLPGAAATLAQVHERVRNDCLNDRIAHARDQAYAKARSRYDIRIAPIDAAAAAQASAGQRLAANATPEPSP
jgi:hypothetical protein